MTAEYLDCLAAVLRCRDCGRALAGGPAWITPDCRARCLNCQRAAVAAERNRRAYGPANPKET